MAVLSVEQATSVHFALRITGSLRKMANALANHPGTPQQMKNILHGEDEDLFKCLYAPSFVPQFWNIRFDRDQALYVAEMIDRTNSLLEIVDDFLSCSERDIPMSFKNDIVIDIIRDARDLMLRIFGAGIKQLVVRRALQNLGELTFNVEPVTQVSVREALESIGMTSIANQAALATRLQLGDLTYERVRGRLVEGDDEEASENAEDETICVVCFSNKRSVAFFPCKHCATCIDCSNRILKGNATCPLCMKPVARGERLFFP